MAAPREQIIQAIQFEDNSKAWEIGPGIGALTHIAVKKNIELTVFEIDYGFCSILHTAFDDQPNFFLIEGDVLKNWEKVWKKEGTPDRIFGNLPYNIGSVCIAAFIEKQCLPKKMVFTLQKEVVQRMIAQPGTKAYSSFSILCGVDYKVSSGGDIKAGCFYPVPDVVSAIAVMEKRETPLVPLECRQDFFRVVKDVFAARRKTIRNSLLNGQTGAVFGKEPVLQALEKSGISLMERGENLDIPSILNLSNCIVDSNNR